MVANTPAALAEEAVITHEIADQHVKGGDQSSTRQVLTRIGAVAAIAGVALLLLASFLHPAHADPNDAHAAFAEYAADSFWIWSHLGQFGAFVLLGVALVGLAATLESGRPAALARIGLMGTGAFVTVAAVLQAVDGVALKVMVDRWAESSGEARVLAFDAAIAVRQVEIGLASFLSLTFGLTVVVFGLGIIFSTRYPTWLGVIGVLGGLTTLAGGVAQALTGFSGLAMMISMSSSVLLLVWAVVVGIRMWRLAPRLSDVREAA